MQSCPTDQLYSFLLGNVLISNVQASHLMSYLFLHHLLVMYSSKHLLSYFKNYLAIINFTILSFANCWHLIYNKVLIFKIFTTVLAALKTLALGTFLLLKSTDGMIKKETSQNPSISLVVCLLQWQTTVLMHQVLACACASLINCLSKKNHDWVKGPTHTDRKDFFSHSIW